MIDLKLFEAIGFTLSTRNEIGTFLDTAIEKGLKPSSQRGLYSYWPLGNGAEVWVALDKTRDVLNFDPHFVGRHRVRVLLDSIYDIAEELGGGLKVWAKHGGTDPSQQFPFMVNVPDWDFVHSGLNRQMSQKTGPFVFELQVAAFAEQLSCFASEDEFHVEQQAQGAQWAVGHFVPAGLFVSEGEVPGPQASFSGTILDGQVLTNPSTQKKSWHLTVQTLGMIVDVLADASVLTGRPQKGGIASGYFWMSGRPSFDIEDLQRWLNIRPTI